MPEVGKERGAFVRLDPSGFQIRHPPPPHELDTVITPDEKLFQTVHMGAAVVDHAHYQLVIGGLVERPVAVTLEELKRLPQTTITAFHECYGSPLEPPIEACWRVGNVRWTGVRVSHLLTTAGLMVTTENSFLWSERLDRGTFAGIEADRYQKDLPMYKALDSEVLVAYAMNGEPLTKERGGPVRLVVPGFFGTNSTKWLCRLSVQTKRAQGPYTTTFYNERVSSDMGRPRVRPVWHVEVNSIITRPRPDELVTNPDVKVQGWAWSYDGVENVEVSADDGRTWTGTFVEKRSEYSWQNFEAKLTGLRPGKYRVLARATSICGEQQPLSGHRNHVHHVNFEVSHCD
ncbi:molybdopterin binding oxidoreductase [Setomelanomma holmii]|uniref:Molybdopterin binding oxidoreductase n=1 Tax=Setomelanomma holmii TaxID=210430 RepID=A0A9P4GXS5_9PLEO|nr:molybdopterin binding oxidoreductase [Setomelanomma holmii]